MFSEGHPPNTGEAALLAVQLMKDYVELDDLSDESLVDFTQQLVALADEANVACFLRGLNPEKRPC